MRLPKLDNSLKSFAHRMTGQMSEDSLTCPSCGGVELFGVVELDQINYRCKRCGDCWHIELDEFVKVHSQGCIGCEQLPTCSDN